MVTTMLYVCKNEKNSDKKSELFIMFIFFSCLSLICGSTFVFCPSLGLMKTKSARAQINCSNGTYFLVYLLVQIIWTKKEKKGGLHIV